MDMMNNTRTFSLVSVVIGLMVWASCSNAPEQQSKTNVQYLSGTDEVTYRRIGKEIMTAVSDTLKFSLMRAMGERGPTHAVEFCNAQALSLTASFSKKYDTEVKRTSDRLRNPANSPNQLESAVIADYRAEQAEGKALVPKVVIDAKGRKVFFAPIFTAAPCLVCHGNEANMDEALRERLTTLYPEDNAKGFGIDELRGIWSITFKTS